VGDDEDEVQLAQAQVLMDCLADLLAQKGLDGTRAWCEGGLKLRLKTSEQGSSTWVVLGQLPEEEGQGTAPCLVSLVVTRCRLTFHFETWNVWLTVMVPATCAQAQLEQVAFGTSMSTIGYLHCFLSKQWTVLLHKRFAAPSLCFHLDHSSMLQHPGT